MHHAADHPVALTCPDCGDALRKGSKGSYVQFRCHIGHTFGTPELAEEHFARLESALESIIRMLNEWKQLCRDGASAARLAEREGEATLWDEAAKESEARFAELVTFVEADWNRPEPILATRDQVTPPPDGPGRLGRKQLEGKPDAA